MPIFSSYTTNKNDTAMFVRHNAASIRHHEGLAAQYDTHTLTWRQSSHVQHSKYTKHYINFTSKMIGKTLKHVRLCLFSTCLHSLPRRNEVAYSGGDSTEDVGVASCEAISESLSSMSLGTVSNNNKRKKNTCTHNVLYHVYV